MERNYAAKIVLLAILGHVELKKPGFKTDAFLESLGEADLKDFQLLDKYPIKDYEAYTDALIKIVEPDEAFFLKLGLEGIASNFGSYSFFIQNSPNFIELLTKASQYSHVITDLVSKARIEENETTFTVNFHFSKEFMKYSHRVRRPLIEMCFGGVVVLYTKFAYSQDHKIEFYSSIEHEMSDDKISYLLGHKFTSKADGDYIVFPREVKDIPNVKFEADLPSTINAGLLKHLDAQNTGALVSIITNLLELKPASSLDDISNELHISKRTLQRRLKDQSINFTLLKQNTANQKSIELLDSNNYSLEEIAELLGYSSTATFMHAFTKWHGVSPSAYLKQK